jgi:hypothetical protein
MRPAEKKRLREELKNRQHRNGLETTENILKLLSEPITDLTNGSIR